MTMKRVAFASLSALCCIVAPRCNAEPLVFIVSYHNVDYAKVACHHVLSFEPDAAKTAREYQKFGWGEVDDTTKNILTGAENANPCAIRVSWDGNLKTNL